MFVVVLRAAGIEPLVQRDLGRQLAAVLPSVVIGPAVGKDLKYSSDSC